MALYTKEQDVQITVLEKQGYYWDKQLSCSCAAVVLRKGKDIWIFTLDGEILHNPKMTSVLV